MSSGAWPEFAEAMYKVLPLNSQKDESSKKKPAKWVLLPGLCCQAAGGDPHRADDIAAAWLLFHFAAGLMDSIEDQDEPEAWWANIGSSAAINIATGLFFGASLALNRIYQLDTSNLTASQIVQDFHNSFLTMCSGQHQDLIIPVPTIEQYWKIAEAKSGAFFALACSSGARLGTEELEKIFQYGQYGNQVGLLIQILDDLEEMQVLAGSAPVPKALEFTRCLPVLYAIEVFPSSEGEHLKELLQRASDDQNAAMQAFHMIEQSGAGLFLTTEIRRHKDLARKALQMADPQPPAGNILHSYLEMLGPHE